MVEAIAEMTITLLLLVEIPRINLKASIRRKEKVGVAAVTEEVGKPEEEAEVLAGVTGMTTNSSMIKFPLSTLLRTHCMEKI